MVIIIMAILAVTAVDVVAGAGNYHLGMNRNVKRGTRGVVGPISSVGVGVAAAAVEEEEVVLLLLLLGAVVAVAGWTGCQRIDGIGARMVWKIPRKDCEGARCL
jgi:hypothetical protein